ncbi:MAG: hypothetical protein A2514_03130 [Gammaproteobacteria bacterium RIFOXYD12_FULL_61_37]|nr:MAG: hypothetical protein A2514_03130 [Gammaproteobacteria bacterium RIFOXYD12_FULL_61_37]
MFAITEAEASALSALGNRLRRRRLALGETQSRAAARLGVSLPTYRKLEYGDSSAQIGAWMRALRLFGSLDELDALFPESLFDEAAERQRAPRRKP